MTRKLRRRGDRRYDMYDYRYIVGLTGFHDSGRDEVADVLGNLHGWARHDFERIADSILELLDPMLVDEFLPGEFEQLRKVPRDRRRTLLDYQRLVHNLRAETGVVLDAWEAEARGVYENLVCSDVDHPAESAVVYAAGGVVIRIINPESKRAGQEPLVAGQTAIVYKDDPIACAERVLDAIGFANTLA